MNGRRLAGWLADWKSRCRVRSTILFSFCFEKKLFDDLWRNRFNGSRRIIPTADGLMVGRVDGGAHGL